MNDFLNLYCGDERHLKGYFCPVLRLVSLILVAVSFILSEYLIEAYEGSWGRFLSNLLMSLQDKSS